MNTLTYKKITDAYVPCSLDYLITNLISKKSNSTIENCEEIITNYISYPHNNLTLEQLSVSCLRLCLKSVGNKYISLIKKFIDNGADPVYSNKKGYTLLYEVICNKNLKLIEFLVPKYTLKYINQPSYINHNPPC
jgi:hypothetical protein